VTNQRKRSRLSEAFGSVASRTGRQEAPEREDLGRKIQKSDTVEIETVPGRGGKPIAANTPVNRTFTVTAKERYEWTVELRRRGLSAVSVLRRAMNELLKEGKD
jgi:hypothetical protein